VSLPPQAAEDDTRTILACNPKDEAALRPLAEALGLRVHVSVYGPDPGQVYLFDPTAVPLPRVEFQYLGRPVADEDPWAEMKRRIMDGLLRPPPAIKITDVC